MLNKEQAPSVAVIIPCRNEAAFIGRCLGSIVANLYPVDRLDILVVDGNPIDNVRTLLDPLLVISNGRIGLDRLSFAK